MPVKLHTNFLVHILHLPSTFITFQFEGLILSMRNLTRRVYIFHQKFTHVFKTIQHSGTNSNVLLMSCCLGGKVKSMNSIVQIGWLDCLEQHCVDYDILIISGYFDFDHQWLF